MWDLTIHPFEGPVSSLAHHSMSSSDTICNSSSPLLVDIICFSLLLIVSSLTVLKCVYLGEDSTPLQGMFHSPLQPMCHLKIHPLGGHVLTDTPPAVWL